MSKSTFVFAALLPAVALAFTPITMSVPGVGVGYGPDPQSARADAEQGAQQTLQNNCVGRVIESHKTGDQCTSNIGDNDNPKYMCTIGYVGTCRSGG
jgi:hypothetical protein